MRKYSFLSRLYLLLFVRFSSRVCQVLTESFLVIRCKKGDRSQKNYQSRITLTFREYISMPHCMPFNTFMAFLLASGVTVIWPSPRFGHPIPKTLVMWVFPLTLTQIAKVVWEGDAFIARVFNGNGNAQNAGMPISLSHRGYSTDFTMGVCCWVFETLYLFHTK